MTKRYNVDLSEPAEGDLEHAADWYIERHPRGYDRFVRDFQVAIDILTLFPFAGRERSNRPGLRSYYVHPYVMFYTVDERKRLITVVRVIHGRMDIDPDEIDD